MDTLGIFFSFPHWWGHNWDALNDCIKDGELSTLPSQFHIIWMENLQKNLKEDARIFGEILDENNIEYTLLPFSTEQKK